MASEKCADGAEVDRHAVDLATMYSKDPVPIVGKFRKSGDVGPNLIARSVENMRAVGMIFYSGRGVDFRPAVAAAMRPPVDDKNGNAGLAGDALRHRGAEQAGADNDKPILAECR